MAALVASTVVGPLVKIVMDKVSSYLLNQHKVMKGMREQLDRLERKLLAISGVITDVEEVASHRAGAKAWLEKAKKEAYQANEVFNEFKYEELRREAKKKGHYKELGFHVRHEPLPVSHNWRQKDQDIFDPKEIARRSRAKENKKLVDILVGQAESSDLTVIPIVGMGGLGKTTLAQLVYNDLQIQKHFDLLLWVCVSGSFDVDTLAKSIVEAAPEKDDCKEVATSKKKNTPLDILQNVVSGQRYLLVLDDVWNREVDKRDVDKWEQLKARLQHGGMGSVVLTTTRDERVAEIMRTVEAYNLTVLEDRFIKEIIETRAFSYFHKKEERPAVLVNMVDEIVKRCVGSPLAATALGAVLRNKTSEEEWKAVSSISNICTAESGILPILKLSYNDLSSQMKLCFAFCAIFPKDYEIDVDKLIRLWIAHGFIVQENQVRLETTGKRIFNELASKSFFQDVKQIKATFPEIKHGGFCYSRTTCKIHDLMHDVALSVMEKECALATEEPCNIGCVVASEEPSQSEWLPNTARHLFLSCEEAGRKLNSSLENKSPTIQTLLCDNFMRTPFTHLLKYNSLQALKLCLVTSSCWLKPKYLHHLRYLDLSRSRITLLPGDLSILYNLQTLNLSGCKYLRELPRQMKYMIALRHLYTHGCPELKSMPNDIRKLTSLQTLTCFVAGSVSNCSNIGELGNLNLRGQLEIQYLANVTEEDAKAANLAKKKELRELTLRWNNFMETSCGDDAVVLERLKPHDGLHAIRIYSYRATTFPTWMVMLQNIVEIHLFSCIKLQWLFTRHRDTSFAFLNLKELTLQDLACLEMWWEMDNDGMQGEEIMFPLLERLCIRNCKKLTTLPRQPTFPKLQNTRITGCPGLTTTAFSPKLSELNVEGCEAELFLWVSRHMTSLTNLKLDSTEDSTETTSATAAYGLREVLDGKEKESDHDFPLTVFVLRNFKSSVTELCACFVHLQDLSILGSHALIHWPEKEFNILVFLRRFRISGCNNLTGYAQASAEPSTSSETSQLLPCLNYLSIYKCENLVEVFNIPASLRRMKIHNCDKLECIYGRRLQQLHSSSSIHQGSSSSPGAGAEHLEVLELYKCPALTGVLQLPPSLKRLYIDGCGGLSSLESCSGELSLLNHLRLWQCNTLSSLPDCPYSSLQALDIAGCPGLRPLPTNLQQVHGLPTEHADGYSYDESMHVEMTCNYLCL